METSVQPRVLARTLAHALFMTVAVLLPLTAPAQTFKVVHAFAGSPDGGNPYAGLTPDASGNLYGTTPFGGTPGCFANVGCGTIFELTPTSGGWAESVLYSFTGASDGAVPLDSLALDADGNLYGTTELGGVSCGQSFGCGVAFELSPGSGGWTETVLHSFQGGSDGYYPIAGLTFDKRGHLYSTLPNGGSGGVGVVYELTHGTGGWKKKTLYSFNGNSTGIEPIGAPILDAAGNLYGTTSCCGTGGAVWELLRGSWKEKTLYSFASGGGANSWAGLVFDKAGNLYGTTRGGGKYGNGAVFKLAREAGGQWKETVLHAFKGGSDGDQPFSTPVFDSAGNLYGTTAQGGDPSCNPPYGCGTVFRLTPGKSGRWKETVLHRFSGSDGSTPLIESLVLDANGDIYGTTEYGGNAGCYQNFGCGVVFEITP